MSSGVFRQYGPIVLSAVMLAACSNGDTQIRPPVAAQPQNAANPEATKGDLLYISDPVKNVVNIYSYPQDKLIGRLSAVKDPEGLCADNAGDLWVVETAYSEIVEFARGGSKPIATLADGEEYPDACAVDRRNGDLAVANNNNGGSDPGSVAIYAQGRGTPTIYSDRDIWFVYFLDFDGHGNLFVDGTAWNNRGQRFKYAELPRGASKLINIKIEGAKIKFPGGVQHDNGGIAIGDGKRHVIYQTSDGTVTGHTVLHRLCKVSAFFIAGAQVIAPNACGTVGHPGRRNVLIYNYPGGGAPIKKLTGFSVPFGVVVTE